MADGLRRLLVAALVVTLATALFALGLWQLERAREKERLALQYSSRAAAPPLQLSGAEQDVEAINYQHVTVRGRYEQRYQFLLTNQVHQGRLGYHVVTPLRIAGSERLLLVNRGWVPHDYAAGGVAVDVAAPDAGQELTGIVAVPRHNLFVREAADEPGRWPQQWAALDPERFARLSGEAVMPFVVLLDAGDAGGGFLRQWPAPNLRSDKNRGYAFQWFAMSLAVVLTWLVVQYRRRRDGSGRG